MHRDEASREAFEVALRLQPENPRALVNLVIARSGCGEAPQALLADLAPALGLVPPVAEALHTQANLLIDAGCHHEALAVLQWPAVDPCSIDHRRAFCVARALWSLGDVGQAEEILRTCLSESSELPEVHELLADLLLTRAVPERSPFNRVGVPVDSVRIDRDLLRAAAASYGDAARRFVSQGRSQDAAKCWVNRACCLTEAGELDAARQAYADIDTAALPKWNGRSPLKNCLRSAPYRTGTVLGNSSRLLRHST